MKNIFLTIVLTLMSIFSVSANENITDENNIKNIKFSKVVISAPCNLKYGVSNETSITVTNNIDNNIYYKIKNDVLYIKTHENDLIDCIDTSETLKPTIYLMNKDILPLIKTGTFYHIYYTPTKITNGKYEIASHTN